MAEYLLGGAKMLAEVCPKCGAPMFEVKGKRMCVVCAETGKNSVETAKTAPDSKYPDTLRVITPKYAAAPVKSVPVSDDIPARLDALILQFCARAEGEPDPSRCLSYMECIRTAAEARVMLNR
ncbi:hypothetical protein McpCs1_02510 [Methanocorpusculaceae archaeon Cs1]|uniref:Sjogrens syndrome scleroderma autoantigen 1 n=2 Tax=Methanorbis rubei TaxID=3028300 RepID=A0AAE4SBM4_9EURY|nr:hypothetical protein [Methanocorpusculaceae archaeon Cs1]